jgi:hypothetical protein
MACGAASGAVMIEAIGLEVRAGTSGKRGRRDSNLRQSSKIIA